MEKKIFGNLGEKAEKLSFVQNFCHLVLKKITTFGNLYYSLIFFS